MNSSTIDMNATPTGEPSRDRAVLRKLLGDGMVHLRAGQLTDALDAYRRAHLVAPDDAGALKGLIRVALRTRDHGVIAASIPQLATLVPEQVGPALTALMRDGALLEAARAITGLNAETIAELDLLHLVPSLLSTLATRAQAYRATGDSAVAAALLRAALLLRPGSARYRADLAALSADRMARAVELAQAGDHVGVADLCESILKEDEGHAAAARQMASACLAVADLDRARIAIDAMVKAGDSDPRLIGLYIGAAEEAGKLTEAVTLIERLAEKPDEKLRTLRAARSERLARRASRAGDPLLACRAALLSRAAGNDGTSLEAVLVTVREQVYRLLRTAIRAREIETVRQVGPVALSADPANADVSLLLARFFAAQRDHAAAEPIWRALCRAGVATPETLGGLARSAYARRDFHEAMGHALAALAQAPSDVALLRLLERLRVIVSRGSANATP